MKMPEKYTTSYPAKRIYSNGRAEDTEVQLARECSVKLFLNEKIFTTLFAALIDTEGELAVQIVDVGRHNAVDKAIGTAFLRELDILQLYMLSTGSLHIWLQKLRGPGIPLIATKAMPFDSGVEAAEKANVCLVGQLRKESMLIFASEWRIRLSKH